MHINNSSNVSAWNFFARLFLCCMALEVKVKMRETHIAVFNDMNSHFVLFAAKVMHENYEGGGNFCLFWLSSLTMIVSFPFTGMDDQLSQQNNSFPSGKLGNLPTRALLSSSWS